MSANLEFFETPSSCVHALAPHLPCASDTLDPCAGRGAILRALGEHPEKFPGLRGIELDPAHTGSHPHPTEYDDALSLDWGSPRLVVANPPFSRAQEFLEKALAEVSDGGTVAFLLRLAFMASRRRAPFHRACQADLYVLADRPSFCLSVTCEKKCWRSTLPVGSARPRTCPECGAGVRVSSSDASEFGWFVYGPGRGGRWFVLGGEA